MGKLIDLVNHRFGRLTVLTRNGKSKTGDINWLCQCDCGNVVTINNRNLRNGRTKSCGCIHDEKSRDRMIEMLKTQKGVGHPRWKGDSVGKMAAHIWLRKNKTKPHFCERCKERIATELSYNYENRQWTRDVDDYEYLCNSCHQLKDRRNGAKPMTKDRIKEIRNLYTLGIYSYRKLGNLFKVSQTIIYEIIKHKNIYAQ